jgi:hypothetical protein
MLYIYWNESGWRIHSRCWGSKYRIATEQADAERGDNAEKQNGWINTTLRLVAFTAILHPNPFLFRHLIPPANEYSEHIAHTISFSGNRFP